jgi:hypothetical protein
MPIPNSDRHGLWINDGSATPKLAHAAWTNNGGMTAAKEIWINDGTVTPKKVWPPRAYVVELVLVGSYNGNTVVTLVDTTNTSATTSSTNGLANIGNWNAIWGGVQNNSGDKQLTFAFRRWDRYDANGHYDFSLPNKVRRTTATGSIVGQGHGGLWKTLLQTSPYNPNDNRTHSPFVVIEPGSKILCIRLHSTKTFSGGPGEANSGPMGTITFVSGNATYFGSPSITAQSFGVNTGTDVPSTQDQPIGLIVNSSSNQAVAGFGIVSVHGNKGGFGVSTSSTVLSANTLNNGTWMTNKNYSSTPTSTLYGYDNSTTLGSTTIVSPGTLPALTTGVGGNTNSVGSGHVGWKYITIDSDDSEGADGTTWYNFMMTAQNFTANRSLGSTLFLVIPP